MGLGMDPRDLFLGLLVNLHMQVLNVDWTRVSVNSVPRCRPHATCPGCIPFV